ncbi:MAG TPA: NADH-quinone oxidoreductase subunit L [Vicinamibacterales bacterium]|nr:NADH-quinone oxidoreductase subunit L [Vicinamibacterales bacterium]
MLLLIALLPFLGFLVNASFGRRVSKGAAGAVACGVMVGSFVVSGAAVWRLIALPPEARAIVQHVYTWFSSGDFSVAFTLRLDPLSSVMILVITGIGALIHVYSTAYMHEETDSEFARYFSYLNLFAAFMLVLVLGANMLVMFVGWEGVGLCSYLLVGFWYQKKSASDAGKKAFIVNRVGDFAFVLGILLTFVRFGSIDFQTVAQSAAALGPETAFGTMSLITLLLFIGATGKSAQIPLYVWLPDAMEGPTPVSALIHAATMVTAGVYMIGRNAVLFSHAPETLAIVAVIGVATALMAGTIGLVQNDIKRVLAYSTVSQLGYMFLAMGVGAFSAGIFHLYTHAFFKALLFLGSGAVIHALSGEQDMRRMGGLRTELPITYWTFLIGSLAIAGVPFLSGFFSKDEILYRTYASGHTVLWVVGLLTSLLTAIYMFRVVFLTFHGERAHETSSAGHHGGHLHDAPPAMALALIALAIGAVVAGYAGLPASLGGSDRFATYLQPSFTAAPIAARADLDAPAGAEAAEGLELGLMAVSSAAALGGIGLAFFFFLRRKSAARAVAERFSGLHRLLLNKYYVDEIYDAAIVQPIRIASEEGLWKVVDVQIIDGLVNGVGESVSGGGDLLRRLQTGSVRAYAASLFFGVVVLLGYLLWR